MHNILSIFTTLYTQLRLILFIVICIINYYNMYKAQIGNLHTDDFERDWWWPIGRNIVVCFMYTPITDNTTYDYYK